MLHLYPHARATLKNDSYFTDFTDSSGLFQVFDEDEGLGTRKPFITIEQDPVDVDQTDWGGVWLRFNVIGDDTQKPLLWEIANKIDAVFKGAGQFVALGTADPVQYELIGKAIFDNGRNPVTGNATVSLARCFGIA
jgi:hypothetical protein